jgi:hypothetical protein
MDIILLITNHCSACARARTQLKSLQKSHAEINAKIQHVNSYNDDKIFITPAWIVNGELFAYGDINKNKIIAKLN